MNYLSKDGRNLYCDAETFIDKVVSGECCAICIRPITPENRSKEHVLPNWVLRKYELHDGEANLPLGGVRRYGRSKLICCAECNALMGRVVEQPVRMAARTQEGERADPSSQLPLIVWLNWFFLKLMLTDRDTVDRSDPASGRRFGDTVEWETLHHLHCMARIPYTGATLGPGVVGSMAFVFPVNDKDRFHFFTIHQTNTIFIKFGHFAIIANLDDGGLAYPIFTESIVRHLRGPVSFMQAIELGAEMAVCRTLLPAIPDFYTAYDRKTDSIQIMAQHPEPAPLQKVDRKQRAEILELAFRDFLDRIVIGDSPDTRPIDAIRAGRFSMIFDAQRNHMVPTAPHFNQRPRAPEPEA